MTLATALLLLADSRLPAGTHAHSGGLEPAATAGVVTDVDQLEGFLYGRLVTTGLVTAALAAAACVAADPGNPVNPGNPADPGHPAAGPDRRRWVVLDAEADARMPSPAGRRASRAQGRSLLRAVRAARPDPVLDPLGETAGGPHHPLVLGAAVAVVGGGPEDAASITAYGAVTGPASAAIRLLGLDPMAVQRVLAELAARVDQVAAEAAACAHADPADLPAASAPALDLFAELHLQARLRLFES